jgi:hypothetical protein
MTTKSALQSRQQGHALFVQRGQRASKAAKGLGESLATKATGDLLLPFDQQIDKFFFDRHVRTLLGLTPFGKSQRTWAVTFFVRFLLSIVYEKEKNRGESLLRYR